MKKIIVLFAATVAATLPIVGQDSKPTAPAEAAALNPAETKFKELLNNATMSGRWYPVKDGVLGEQKDDQYVIVGVTKVKDDSWVVNTKMKYRDREMVMPLPIQVKWAGDTPVIVVDNLAV